MPINKEDLQGWLKEPIWIVYNLNVKLSKSLQVAVGQAGFRVIHGKEIVYDGPHMTNAIEAYNNIHTPPNPIEEPKLNN